MASDCGPPLFSPSFLPPNISSITGTGRKTGFSHRPVASVSTLSNKRPSRWADEACTADQCKVRRTEELSMKLDLIAGQMALAAAGTHLPVRLVWSGWRWLRRFSPCSIKTQSGAQSAIRRTSRSPVGVPTRPDCGKACRGRWYRADFFVCATKGIIDRIDGSPVNFRKGAVRRARIGSLQLQWPEQAFDGPQTAVAEFLGTLRDFRNSFRCGDWPDVRKGKTNLHGQAPDQRWRVFNHR